MNARTIFWGLALALLVRLGWAEEKPFLTSELLFAEHWHCHASCIVETQREICWSLAWRFRERTADDVPLKACASKGARKWTSDS
jgi:hypothetical protein